MTLLRAVKGMNDLFSDELATWRHVEKTTAEVFSRYGFEEIRTPILEDLSLFVRSVGETTDIVEKEMYVLNDKDDKLLCLRPENTAGVVRALVENNKLGPDSEIKTYYTGPMFRRERPQRGRLRQFHQIGAEYLGVSEPSVDVEVIAMLHDLLSTLGLNKLNLAINTLGYPEERGAFVKALKDYFSNHLDTLCEDCRRRLCTNTLRILDCKKPACIALTQNAPDIAPYLSDESKRHFDDVQKGLTALSIPFEISKRLVRGLDYYTRTVFEIMAETGLGSQNTVAGGGRYDHLVNSLGGGNVPAFGFAAGIERIVLLLNELSLKVPANTADLTLVYADEKGRAFLAPFAHGLRQAELRVDFEHKEKSVKAQMRRADRLASKAVMVIGEREITEQKATLKWLKSGESTQVALTADAIQSLFFSEQPK